MTDARQTNQMYRVAACQRRRVTHEGGQTLPLVVLFMVVVLGMAGLAIDLGDGYFQRQQVQNAADAAALAGAAEIPSGTWQSSSTTYAALNDKPGDDVSASYNGTDTVTVTVTRSVPTYLLSLFGKSSITVSATASAKIEALAQVSGHISPYAVTQQVYANGTGTTLFLQNQPGAYGTIDLPAASNTSGGSCVGTTNLGTPPNIKAELTDTLPAGQLVVGGCVSVKSGAAQPSATVIDSIAPGNDEMANDLQDIGNGVYRVIPHSWDDANGLPPRLMYVPIVNTLPNGNGQATITGFAWFYMTHTSGSGHTLQINGQFISLQLPAAGNTVAYVPGASGQVLTTELTQ
ncbi:MAG: pilus assembly protein TadG-related protein [Gaiellales bacterium]